MFEITIFISAMTISIILTGLVRRYALKRGVIDTPNSRSSHKVPTPRGGGLGIVVVFLGALLGLGLFGELEAKLVLALAIGGGLMAGVGFVDDHRQVPALWRFIMQVATAVIVLVALGGLPSIQLGHRVFDLGLTGDLLAVFFMVWFTNAFNFMDGIDGIAASEAASIAAGGALLVFWAHGSSVDFALLIVIAASSLGFLVWNWPPAKIFMGDVGSAFLGFVIFAVAILSSATSSIPIWSWLILGGVFIVDASITLSTRILTKEDWVSPHKSHAYQIASRRFNSHKVVTIGVVLVNAFWLFPMAAAATLKPEIGWWLTAIAWTPIVWVSLFLGAGRKES